MPLLDELSTDEINAAIILQHKLQRELSYAPMYGEFYRPMRRSEVKLLYHVLTVTIAQYLTQRTGEPNDSDSE